MRVFGISLFVLSLVWFGIIIGKNINGDYQYEKQYGAYWSMSYKVSTIPEKAKYIDMFVDKLERSPFKNDYDAVRYKTMNNSFNYNFEALKTLQKRLHDIEKMDITSLQYQMSIAQITAQEQDTKKIVGVIEGIWWKNNHFCYWGWMETINILLMCFTFIVGLCIWIWLLDDDF